MASCYSLVTICIVAALSCAVSFRLFQSPARAFREALSFWLDGTWLIDVRETRFRVELPSSLEAAVSPALARARSFIARQREVLNFRPNSQMALAAI